SPSPSLANIPEPIADDISSTTMPPVVTPAPAPTSANLVDDDDVGNATADTGANPTDNGTNTSQTTATSDDSTIAAAEPIAQEEAELEQQLTNSVNTASDADESNTATSSAGAPEAAEPVTAAMPPSAAPVEAVPAAPANQAVEASSPAPANHDDVLAAALKELEGEASGPDSSNPASPSEAPKPPEANSANSNNTNAIPGRKVIQPLDSDPDKPDINQLLATEKAAEPTPTIEPPVDTTEQNATPSQDQSSGPANPGSISL
ncbi:MAG: hypothetical protein ACREBW_10750, partial [Candidatus Micrarchaeaceae archaeon]